MTSGDRRVEEDAMNNYSYGHGRFRTPGPSGIDHGTGLSPRLRQLDPPAPKVARHPVLKLYGPYPFISFVPGNVANDYSAARFVQTESRHMYRSYGSIAGGTTHTDILFEVSSDGQRKSAYDTIIPAGTPEVSIERKTYIDIPAGSRMTLTNIPVKNGKNNLADYATEIEALKRRNPNTIFLLSIELDRQVQIIGFDRTSSTLGSSPYVGKDVEHMFSNTAYSSFTRGTLTPDDELPCDYKGNQSSDPSVVSKRDGATSFSAEARHINAIAAGGAGLKLALGDRDGIREKVFLPTTASNAVLGRELTASGSKNFCYFDCPTATYATITLKPGEASSLEHPALRAYLDQHNDAAHLCRVITDYSGSERTSRFEILTLR